MGFEPQTSWSWGMCSSAALQLMLFAQKHDCFYFKFLRDWEVWTLCFPSGSNLLPQSSAAIVFVAMSTRSWLASACLNIQLNNAGAFYSRLCSHFQVLSGSKCSENLKRTEPSCASTSPPSPATTASRSSGAESTSRDRPSWSWSSTPKKNFPDFCRWTISSAARCLIVLESWSLDLCTVVCPLDALSCPQLFQSKFQLS